MKHKEYITSILEANRPTLSKRGLYNLFLERLGALDESGLVKLEKVYRTSRSKIEGTTYNDTFDNIPGKFKEFLYQDFYIDRNTTAFQWNYF